MFHNRQVLYSGYLLKKSRGGRWQKRYVMATYEDTNQTVNTFTLEYYKTSEQAKTKRRGTGRQINLFDDVKDTLQRRPSYASYFTDIEDTDSLVRDQPHLKHEKRHKYLHHFFLVTPDRTWQFNALNATDKLTFIAAIDYVMNHANGTDDDMFTTTATKTSGVQKGRRQQQQRQQTNELKQTPSTYEGVHWNTEHSLENETDVNNASDTDNEFYDVDEDSKTDHFQNTDTDTDTDIDINMDEFEDCDELDEEDELKYRFNDDKIRQNVLRQSAPPLSPSNEDEDEANNFDNNFDNNFNNNFNNNNETLPIESTITSNLGNIQFSIPSLPFSSSSSLPTPPQRSIPARFCVEGTTPILIAGSKRNILIRLVDTYGITIPMTHEEAESITLKIQQQDEHAVFYPPGIKISVKEDTNSDDSNQHNPNRTCINEYGESCPISGLDFNLQITNAGLFDIDIGIGIGSPNGISSRNQLANLPIQFLTTTHNHTSSSSISVRVVPSAPDPDHCIIGGPGIDIYPMKPTQLTYCTIIACDRFGNVLRTGGCQFDVIVSGNGVRLREIVDHQDGTYQVWYGVGNALLRDVTMSILLRGCPLPQSPLAPVGSADAMGCNSTLQNANSDNSGVRGVRYLMENTSNNIMVSRSLRALASFALSDIVSVVGAENAPRVYSAAWSRVIERSQTRRLSQYTSPSKVSVLGSKGSTTGNSLNFSSPSHTNNQSSSHHSPSLNMHRLMEPSTVRASTPILDLSSSVRGNNSPFVSVRKRKELTTLVNFDGGSVKGNKEETNMKALSKVLRRKYYSELHRQKLKEKKHRKKKQVKATNAVEKLLMVQRQLETRHAVLIGNHGGQM